MELQNELFPLPKKQKSLFGNAKGTVLGESPANSRQSYSRNSEGKNVELRSPQPVDESKPVEVRDANRVLKPRYHRCDPNKPAIHHRKRDEAKPFALIKEIDRQADDFIEDILNELHEDAPVVDDANEPLPIPEEIEPIQIFGHVTHVDPAHENPYERNQSLWQSVRNFLKSLFHN